MSFTEIPVNTYIANGGWWMFWGVEDEFYSPGPTQIDEVVNPFKVVTFFETIRDWSQPPRVESLRLEDLCCLADYQNKWEYDYTRPNERLTAGRHFRVPSTVGQDPWGKDNVSLVDGHVTQISLKWLVDNGPIGNFLSYPFSFDNERSWGPATSEPDQNVDIWTVPWW